jgi:hypothetical protein
LLESATSIFREVLYSADGSNPDEHIPNLGSGGNLYPHSFIYINVYDRIGYGKIKDS